MMNDEQLRQLLRAAMPADDAAATHRDLWPDVVRRSESPPRFSSADLSVAAIVAIVLLMFPKWFLLLAYQL